MSPAANGVPEWFALQRGSINGRLDPHFYKPRFQALLTLLRTRGAVRLADIVGLAAETWNQKDGRFGAVFPYIEISAVGLGNNEYQVAKVKTEEAPSRARIVVRKDDIIVSLTRPNRGAIASIRAKDDGAIASTGFAVLRELLRGDVTKEYLLLALSSNFSLDQMLMRSSGGNYPAITEDELGNVLIPCPGENWINDIVGSMDVARATRQEKLAEADRMITGLDGFLLDVLGLIPPPKPKNIFAIYMGNLTGVLNPERYRGLQLEHHLPFKDTINIVGILLEARCAPEREAPEALWDWIRIDDLPNQPWQIEKLRTVLGKDINGTFFEVRENDILVSRLGPTIQNGKFVVCPKLNRRTVASSEFLVIRCNSDWQPEAVLWLLRTSLYREIMYARSRGATPSRFRLSGADLLTIPFPKMDDKTQTRITTEVHKRRNESRRLLDEAEDDWKASKLWFEGQLLGGDHS